ncbi:thermonuclease family protein [Rhizobium sp. KVB221]|uniref:Thermonuclease family protein n=1 Tax=Rhizobium setariae TaxID=2801340 RepID=A0A937CNT9_9HYPH|nr:thermonuclease family protein [Rhizobium setariae]MBL0374136.1 thermonuclease family protein [Rhizobium setariae]
MIVRALIPLLVCLAISLQAANAVADRKDRYYMEGPVEAELISIIDGDTLLVAAKPWPQQTVSVSVRIRGVDAPEMKSKCPETRTRAQAARQALADMLDATDGRLSLSSISGDKYFGRVVADVISADGRDAGAELLAAGLARAYAGGRKAKETCRSH